MLVKRSPTINKEIAEAIQAATHGLFHLIAANKLNCNAGYPAWDPHNPTQYPAHPRKHTKNARKINWVINRKHAHFARWAAQQKRALTPDSQSSYDYACKQLGGHPWFEYCWTGDYAWDGRYDVVAFTHYVLCLESIGRPSAKEDSLDRVLNHLGYTFANIRMSTPHGQRENQGVRKPQQVHSKLKIYLPRKQKHAHKSTNHGMGSRAKGNLRQRTSCNQANRWSAQLGRRIKRASNGARAPLLRLLTNALKQTTSNVPRTNNGHRHAHAPLQR